MHSYDQELGKPPIELIQPFELKVRQGFIGFEVIPKNQPERTPTTIEMLNSLYAVATHRHPARRPRYARPVMAA